MPSSRCPTALAATATSTPPGRPSGWPARTSTPYAPYEVGDDLRRVHWPSTARRDELMIRQNETPWQGRATVLLDTRARFHTGYSFEAAVSAAASVLTACWQRRSLIRLMTTDGADSGFGTGPGHLELMLSRLAVIDVSDHGGLAGLTAGHAGDGAIAAVTTAAVPPAEMAALAGWVGSRRSSPSSSSTAPVATRRPPGGRPSATWCESRRRSRSHPSGTRPCPSPFTVQAGSHEGSVRVRTMQRPAELPASGPAVPPASVDHRPTWSRSAPRSR